MSIRTALLIAALAVAAPLSAKAGTDALHGAVASPKRTPAFVERDKYRHPEETLRFFGIKPTMTVVEIWPSAGYYAEILAPMLRARGRYIGAVQANPKYREATLNRLEDESREFRDFLERLRMAKDRSEFDQFMRDRRSDSGPTKPDAGEAQPS